MSTLIDAAWCRNHEACYGNRYLAELFDHPHTIREVLTRRDGLWKDVPDEYRIWVLTRHGALPDGQLREWLARLVERALARVVNPDPRSMAVVAALRHADRIPIELVLGAECAYLSAPAGDARWSAGAAWMAASGAAANFVASLNTSPVAAASLRACSAAAAYTAEYEIYQAAYCCIPFPFSDSGAASEFSAQITDALEILE